MNWLGSGLRLAVVCTLVTGAGLIPARAAAQQSEDSVREASAHFRRGVELYGEADYAGALVEFRRAYALSPSPTALYNAGESQYQLQDYAGALKTFRRYLAEAGPNEGHRTEVEGHVQVLRTRVGHVLVSTVPPGADVVVDDQAVGKTPIREPILVSIGHRRVVASMPGRLPVAQYVDVAAGDDASVVLSLPPSTEIATSFRTPPGAVRPKEAASEVDRGTLRAIGWVSTGVLTAGAITFGALALNQSSVLRDARGTLTTSSVLNHDANLTATYAALADSLAAAAVVMGGLSLYWSLSSGGDPGAHAGALAGALAPRIALAPGAVRLEMSF